MEWSTASKAALVNFMSAPVFMQYAYWASFAQSYPGAADFINVDVLSGYVLQDMVFACAALTLGIFGLWVREHYPESSVYKHITLQSYAVFMSFMGYQIGSLSFSAGILLMSAPLLGLLLFDRTAVLCSLITSFSITLGSVYLSSFGFIEYAPMLKGSPANDGRMSLFWANSMLVFTLPPMLLIMGLYSYIIARWKMREAQVETLSKLDSLTELPNRRYITDVLEREIARAERHKSPISVVMSDLDTFKLVNDSYGHLAGDTVLRETARCLQQAIRNCDFIGRFGGEEFILVLPDADGIEAREIAERCRRSLEALDMTVGPGHKINVSASFGVGSCGGNLPCSPEELIRSADRALYRAKEKGRNSVEHNYLTPVAN